MSRHVRRFPVLATAVLCLLLAGTSIAATPALAGAPPTDTTVNGVDVDSTTIPELEALMNHRRITSLELVHFYIHRIRHLNPELHAVITVSSTIRDEARAADRARSAGSHLPLLGLPIIVKDNIDTNGMPTTAGSWALAGSTPPDAFIVRQLRAAGALILGKANLSEWANFRSAPSSSGWSGVGGQTNMAYVLDRNPCGSSSGSGVAASADLAVAAVGTETDGSIVCPSGANGDVGIKPTLGLLSRAGIVPISAEQDTAGPIARNVTDAAALLGAMTGVDPNDPATADQRGHAFRSYTGFLDAHALRGARIGVWREGTYDPKASPEVDKIVNETIAALKAKGAIIVDPARIPIESAYTPEFKALLCEFKSDIRSYLGAHTASGFPKTLGALIRFNKAHPDLEGPWNSAVFEQAQQTGGRSDPACSRNRAKATSRAQRAIHDTLQGDHLDAIIAPTNGPAWVTDPVNGDLGGDFSTFVGSSSPSAIAGWPSITVPAGYVGHLPVGISFIAGRWDEPMLISLAYAFEQATQVRVPPTFIPSEGATTSGSGNPAVQAPGVSNGSPAAEDRRTPGLR